MASEEIDFIWYNLNDKRYAGSHVELKKDE